MYIGLHVKYPLFQSDFNVTRIFSTDFRKKIKYKISRKSIKREPSFFFMRTDRRTDRHDEANSRFSQFYENALKRQRFPSARHEGMDLEAQLHSFLKLALDGGEWLALLPFPFAPGERSPFIH
jgi:hypothetical protein